MSLTTPRAARVLALIAALLAVLTALTVISAPPARADTVAPAFTSPFKPLPSASATAGTCTAANYVCLYEGLGLTGPQVAVRPAERGGCIDLGAIGWAGRALSAKNTFAREAVTYPNSDCTGRPDGIPGNGSKSPLLYSPGSIWVFDACNYSGSLCLYERVDFNGAEFTAQALNPAVGTCVDLAAHGWGGRAASAVNRNAATAVLYSGTNCTGTSYPVAGNSWNRALGFSANSVFVY
ncbi:peptidase inhibitor family I36 protein [Luedemannella helvata]|uniref:Peptidase inhibitor family I36 n=1 Tax=Luedemannella helvata TaxID=349315 RepID=A0ABN2JY02_9ACTN